MANLRKHNCLPNCCPTLMKGLIITVSLSKLCSLKVFLFLFTELVDSREMKLGVTIWFRVAFMKFIKICTSYYFSMLTWRCLSRFSDKIP